MKQNRLYSRVVVLGCIIWANSLLPSDAFKHAEASGYTVQARQGGGLMSEIASGLNSLRGAVMGTTQEDNSPGEYDSRDMQRVERDCRLNLQVLNFLNSRDYNRQGFRDEVEAMNSLMAPAEQQRCRIRLQRMWATGTGGGKSALFNVLSQQKTIAGLEKMTCFEYGAIDGCGEGQTLFEEWKISCGHSCNRAACCMIKKDECALRIHNCHREATCNDTDASFNCNCNTGWVGDGVTCKGQPCHVHYFPLNGDAGECAGTLLEHDTTCNIRCNEGYSVAGSTSCYNGVLYKAMCEPAPCNASIPPPEGFLGTCDDHVPSGGACQPICAPGYATRGNTRCEAGNITRSARCVAAPCDASAAPENGRSGDCSGNLSSGTICQPECNEGYVASGPSSCSSGFLEAATCSPKWCDSSQPPMNGKLGSCGNRLAHGAFCQSQCNTGFTAIGVTSCKFGQLTKTECAGGICQVGRPPANGQIGNCHTTMKHNERCLYHCDTGYVITGWSTCNAGHLSYTQCVPQHCDASDPPANGRVGDCTNKLLHNSTCQPTCNAGFQSSGAASCQFGVLTPIECNPMRCTSFPPTDGTLGDCPQSGEMGNGDSCQPVCNTGFTVSGRSQCQAGHFISAICSSPACDARVPPVNGGVGDCAAINLPGGNSLAHGGHCIPTCNPGFTVQGSTTCNAGILTKAECRPMGCDATIPPPNGDTGDCPEWLNHGQSCTPRCDRGHMLQGGQSTCEFGQLKAATCKPIECAGPTAPENGSLGSCAGMTLMPHGGVCQISCNLGYMHAGTTSCHLGQVTLGTCEPLSCDASQAPHHGRVGDCTRELAHGGTCQPECNAGYFITGEVTCDRGRISIPRCRRSSQSS